jgi:hypothetical protein
LPQIFSEFAANATESPHTIFSRDHYTGCRDDDSRGPGGKPGKDSTMMFLLRTAFWMSIALALLPSFVPKQAATVPVDVGAADAMTAASATVADLSGFCQRRPDACEAGAQFATAFGQRAQAGAKILYDFVGAKVGKTERIAANGLGPAGNADAPGTEAAKSSQHTLTAADIAPPWRGQHPRKDASAKRTS